MAEFPCPLERTVASALLLLSAIPPSPSLVSPPLIGSEDQWLKDGRKTKSYRESLLLSDSTAVSLKNESRTIVRKSRSKIHYSSCDQEISSAEKVKMSSASVSTDASYLSSSSSPLSSGRSHRSGYVTRGEKTQKRLATTREEIRRKHVGSVHMRRRSEDILKLLSGGCSSELKIRQLLGDSPDTSKALRMLLKLEEVKRSGTGGRRDPYIYKIA
ncbi:hypothetical protein F2P56_006068 [Juglans regia]|uniref:HTH three-helical bundle domain-containing protein n=1 Tax=Juglans regia TaxID=51240 RepID=A0A833XZN3_JUGRE|nr:hypothetical protein F2P56_006068 [Juglans regia]